MSHLHIGCTANVADQHASDVGVLLYHKGILYSGGDDGMIKAWTNELSKIAEVQAHPCSVFSLAASEDSIYSCSNEATIKQFDLVTLKEKRTLTKESITEFWKICYANGFLYSGDNMGNVVLWKDGKKYGEANLAEPITDMVAFGNILYTVRENDVVITQLKLSTVRGKRIHYAIKKCIMGRYPLSLVDQKLLIFTSRDGRDIIAIENNDSTYFKTVAKIDSAHELVIKALAGTRLNNKTYLFSGGWDQRIKKWKLDEDIAKLDCTLDVDFVINAFSVGESGEIYAAGSDGHLIRVEIE